MNFSAASARHRRRATMVSLVVSLLGLALFAYTLRQAGLRQILNGLGQVGVAGFAGILLLSGFRLVVRSLAWMRCIEGPGRLRFRDAFTATVMGEALGNVTPFAMLVSEPSKAVFVRHKVPLSTALSAIVVENIFYTATVAFMIGFGAVAMLMEFPLPGPLRWAGVGSLGGMIVVIGSAYLVLRTDLRPVSGGIDWLHGRGVGGHWLGAQLERVRRFEAKISTFSSRNRERLAALGLCEAGFHLAGIAEVYLTLSLIAPDSTTLLKAIVLESAGRVINVLFKFVPMRVGVDEAGNALFARPLMIPTPALVALPLVRKARIMTWTAVGLVLLLMRGLSIRRVLNETERLQGEKQGRA